MKEIAEVVKYAGSIFSAILVCSTFIATVCKPVRKWIVGKIRDIARSDEADKMLRETNELLKHHIEKDDIWKDKIETQLNNQKETDVIQLRNTINHVYEKNLTCKSFSTREKSNVIDMTMQYLKLGGNHYIEQIYSEMMKWDTYVEK